MRAADGPGATLYRDLEDLRDRSEALRAVTRLFLERTSAAYVAAGMPDGDSLPGLMRWVRNHWVEDYDRAILDLVQAIMTWNQHQE